MIAGSAWAQSTGLYALDEGAAVPKDGDQITSVEGVTATWKGAWKSLSKKATNTADPDFNYYMNGNTNGKLSDGTYTGCGMTFETTGDDAYTVEVGVVLNAAKQLCVVKTTGDASTDLVPDGVTYSLPDADGNAQTLGTNKDSKDKDIANSLAAKSMGTVTFTVEKGSTYYVLCLGSKIGIYGFKATKKAIPASILTVAKAKADSNETTYNLAGQRVGQGYKGVVVKGGKKVVK